MQMRMEHQRGQAITETAVFLPLFLLLLYGLIWLAQVSVLNERAQTAVRYSGLISNEASPFNGYSLYAIYNNVGTYTQNESATCETPPPDALTNNPANQAFPGPLAAQFWSPDSGSVSTSCNPSRVKLSDGVLSAPMLLLSTNSSISATKTYAFPARPGQTGSSTLSAQSNFFNTPDIASIMQCYPQLHTYVSASLVGETQGSANPTGTLALPAVNAVVPLSINTTC